MSFDRAFHILVVDDEPANIRLLERLLRSDGYANTTTTTDAREVERLCDETDPDLILLDLHMPAMDGFTVLQRLRERLDATAYLPVLVLTADVNPEARERALRLGARDFVAKPFDRTEVLLRVSNLLETRALHLDLKDQNRRLEQGVRERTSELWDAVRRLQESERQTRISQEETITRLSIAAEFRDDETSRHIHRMSRYSALLARAAGLDRARCETIRIASEMHDVGKIGIPDGILLKPGMLTPQERSTMEEHAEIGHRILEGSRSGLLQLAAVIALSHHERVDGNGYPHRLLSDDIPLEARIATVADVFDALTSDRVYRKAFGLEEALRMMRAGWETHFDGDLLDLFLGSLDEALEIKRLHEEELQVGSLRETG